ncbi:MAG TPA: tRNA preQ1(34) S-adenosylmethionine ribosyltransferase-isomerase QueA [Patescibacteria group bacterium]|nr:tRNA preQ1(34) S-adenosylmethionine ribosyltransferase-isomerase QueA [Patescibacteria group bacterium]
MDVSLFDYHLPKDFIAQKSAHPRDSARLFVVERAGLRYHDFFYNLGKYLKKGDVLVRNVTKVFPARLYATKLTGGTIEILLVRPLDGSRWECLVGGRVKDGMEVKFDCREVPMARFTKQRCVSTTWAIDFGEYIHNISQLIKQCGNTPIPPYIHSSLPEEELREAYQTVYAHNNGSVAAPTAGLHFTDALIEKLKHKGIEFLDITLHVGIGTFLPVKIEKAEDHTIHAEYVEIPDDVAQKICSAKSRGSRIIAIGTTTTRGLEACADILLSGRGYTGEVDIFILPGYEFQIIDGLITNFHLPKSTLLMLVSAFLGRETTLSCYAEAISLHYRFYSFGDAMLLL